MRIKFVSLLALSAILFVGCNKENEDTTQQWNGEINLTTAAVSVRQSKSAPDDQIASGKAVGLFIREDAALPTVNYTQNLAYTADGSGGLSGASTQYYPNTGNGIKVSGYHPHNSGAADSYTFSVVADQSVDANYYNSDLLYAPEAIYARQKTAHTLTFDHKLSKITYTLISGDGSPSLAGASVKLLNILPEATFNRITGVVGAAQGAKITITPNAGGAIVVPQTIAAGTQLIEVSLAAGGKLYHTVPTGGVSFAEGKLYNYEITVNLTGITLTTAVSAWDPVGKTGTAEME